MPLKDVKTSKLDAYQSLKARIHRRLIERLDLSNIDYIDRDVFMKEIGKAVESLIAEEGTPLSQAEKESLIVDIQHETFGLGPLEPLLSVPEISDILVNKYNQVYVEKFGKLQKADIMAFGSLNQNMALLLEGCVRTRQNILISGGTGTGKTTLLNILSEFVSHDERVITIEDSAELQLKQDHVVRLETRPPNIEGKGEVTQRDLVRNALRMRPDRIIVGEVRGGEALDMLQAMNTGHDGSLSTIHANSARDALARLETMVLMAGLDLPERAIREQVSSAIHVVMQLTRFSDGSRKVVSISEITGMEGNTVVMQDIFVYKRKGIAADGRIIGEYVPTGVRPRFIEKFKISGIDLPPHIFEGAPS